MGDVWSGIKTQIRRTKRDLPARTIDPLAVVVHTTGSGIVVKALKRGEEPLEAAAAYYSRKRSYASGYLVGAFAEDDYDGTGDDAIVATVPDNIVAYHAGVSRGRVAIYSKPEQAWTRYLKLDGKLTDTGERQARYDGWCRRWPGHDSPVTLLAGFSDGVNSRTLSVDLLAPEPGQRHSDLQLGWAASLVKDLLERHKIPLNRDTVLRHSDLDPLTRTSRHGGWDPPWDAFTKLCIELGILS